MESRPENRGKLTWDGSHKVERGSLEWICHERFTTLLQWQGFRPHGGLPDGTLLWEQGPADASRRNMGPLLAYRLDIDNNCEPRWKSLDEAEVTEGPSYEEVRSAEGDFVDLLARDGLTHEELATARLEFAHWDPSVRTELDQLYPERLGGRALEVASHGERGSEAVVAAGTKAEWCLSGTVVKEPEIELGRAGELQLRVVFRNDGHPTELYSAVFFSKDCPEEVNRLRKGDSVRVVGEELPAQMRGGYCVELKSPELEVIGRAKQSEKTEPLRLARERW
jgi:hypothetical protein